MFVVHLFLWIQNTYHLKCGVYYYKEWFNCINLHICIIYVFTGYKYVKRKREVRWNWIVFTSWSHHIFSSPKRWCYSPALVTSGFGNHSPHRIASAHFLFFVTKKGRSPERGRVTFCFNELVQVFSMKNLLNFLDRRTGLFVKHLIPQRTGFF